MPEMLHKPESYFEDEEDKMTKRPDLPPSMPERLRGTFREIADRHDALDTLTDDLQGQHDRLEELRETLLAALEGPETAGAAAVRVKLASVERAMDDVAERFNAALKDLRQASVEIDRIIEDCRQIERLITSPGGQA